MMKKKYLFRFYITYLPIIIFSLILFSCEEDFVEENVQNQFLTDYELIATFEAEQLRTLVNFFAPDINTDLILYDMSVYKVIYQTQYQGENIQASGLICMPSDAKVVSFPVLLGFHASISSQQESPSNFSNPLGTGLEVFGSLGYISVIPDYLGFGEASGVFHPYLVKESVSKVSTDMVKAAEEMMQELEQSYSKNLYLAGYSQGAYNAIATLYELENSEILPEWEVIATAAGAGTYDLEALTLQTISNDNYGSPELLAYLIWSYHTYYELPGGAEQYFQQPYADRIPDLFDGSMPLGEIKDQLTTDLSQLLQADFLAAVRNGDTHPLSEALELNSISSWQAESAVNLLHSPNDEVLDITNSQNFYDQLEAAGSNDLTFTTLDAPGHRAGAIPMLLNTIFWFESFQNL